MEVTNMGMAKKVLGAVGKSLTTPNDMGIIGPAVLPRRLNAGGAFLFMGGVGAVGLTNAGIKSHNRGQYGRVSYNDGMARMTNSFTTGAVPAMMEASGGNYAVFADMAEDVVKGHGNFVGKAFDDYGADASLISAIYGMGGR